MLKYWLWLTNLSGLQNQTRLALLRHFGSPEDIYYADEGELLLTEGITRQQAELLRAHDLSAADRVLADTWAYLQQERERYLRQTVTS